MSLPVFFTKEIASLHQHLVLEEDTSRHVSQVLRMRTGELLQLTDGQGNLLTAQLTEAHKKHSAVKIIEAKFFERSSRKTTIAISLLKNANRFEWFLEKATELGIQQIVPLLCDRTERQHFRHDRMHAVLVSAMLQSQQCWLPELSEPMPLAKFVSDDSGGAQKFIAHLVDGEERKEFATERDSSAHTIMLIGPEGDFTKDEVLLALQHDYIPVSLGETRLRTETAGIAAAVLMR